MNSLYFHVIRSFKLCVTDLKDVTDDRQLVKIPWQSWDKGALRSAWRCFVRSYGPLVTSVADRQDISDRPSSPLTSSVGQLHDWHSRYPGNYLQHVSREQEWKPVSFRGFCYKKKISCYTTGGRDCYPKNKSMAILALNTAHCATDQTNNILLCPKHQYDKTTRLTIWRIQQ